MSVTTDPHLWCEIGPAWGTYRCPCGEFLSTLDRTNDEVLEWLEVHRACPAAPAGERKEKTWAKD